MHKNTTLVLTILTIILFLGIRTAYNSSPTFSLFTFIKEDVLHFKAFDWEEASYTESWAFVSYEILISLLFLLSSSFLKNKYWMLLSSLILLAIWLKNYLLYSGIMEGDLYLKSSAFFLLSLIFLNIFNLIFKKNKSV
ncbi:MAG: hypothetical protein K0M56_06550 [Kaistella sp.]|nr:hypothetical protein [Kaistella sp.]